MHASVIGKNPFSKVLSERKLTDLLNEDESKEKDFNKKTMWYHGRNLTRKKTDTKLKESKLQVYTLLFLYITLFQCTFQHSILFTG